MTPEELSAQLRCPHGPQAREVGERVNAANGALTRAAIAALGTLPGERILEIGPGNAAFASLILDVPGTGYIGLDLSPAMAAEGARLHATAIAEGRAAFLLGDAAALPFDTAAIDRVLAVNTLYFWDAPSQVLDGLARVLRPGGVLCLAFADAAFLRGMPFAAHGFRLHEVASIDTMLRDAGFGQVTHRLHHEQVIGNTGEQVERSMHLLVATRD